MTQVTLSQLISHLQQQLDEHGDVGVYKDVRELLTPINNNRLPEMRKIYTDDYGNVDWSFLTEADEDTYSIKRAATTKPITKGLVL